MSTRTITPKTGAGPKPGGKRPKMRVGREREDLDGAMGGFLTLAPRKDNLGHEEIAEFATGAVRSKDQDKIRWELMPWGALREVARVFTWGAKKYVDRNWEKGIPKSRMFGSHMRHYVDQWLGEDHDDETEILHLAQAAWNVLCDLEFVLRGRRDLDDRPREGMILRRLEEPLPVSPRRSNRRRLDSKRKRHT